MILWLGTQSSYLCVSMFGVADYGLRFGETWLLFVVHAIPHANDKRDSKLRLHFERTHIDVVA